MGRQCPQAPGRPSQRCINQTLITIVQQTNTQAARLVSGLNGAAHDAAVGVKRRHVGLGEQLADVDDERAARVAGPHVLRQLAVLRACRPRSGRVDDGGGSGRHVSMQGGARVRREGVHRAVGRQAPGASALLASIKLTRAPRLMPPITSLLTHPCSSAPLWRRWRRARRACAAPACPPRRPRCRRFCCRGGGGRVEARGRGWGQQWEPAVR